MLASVFQILFGVLEVLTAIPEIAGAVQTTDLVLGGGSLLLLFADGVTLVETRIDALRSAERLIGENVAP